VEALLRDAFEGDAAAGAIRLREILDRVGAMRATAELARELASEAAEIIAPLPESPAKRALVGVALAAPDRRR
jgi:geranylgeranyl pyrophosphate synthase